MENPYIARLKSNESAHGRTDTWPHGFNMEIEAMTKSPVLKCGNGHNAYRNATVGCYMCPTCRQMLVNGKWQ